MREVPTRPRPTNHTQIRYQGFEDVTHSLHMLICVPRSQYSHLCAQIRYLGFKGITHCDKVPKDVDFVFRWTGSSGPLRGPSTQIACSLGQREYPVLGTALD